LNEPFEAEVDERGMIDDELTRFDLEDNRLRRSPVAKAGRCEHRHRDEQSHVFHVDHTNSSIGGAQPSIHLGSAGGGNRTLTGGKPHRILSPARLPVSPLRRLEGGPIVSTIYA